MLMRQNELRAHCGVSYKVFRRWRRAGLPEIRIPGCRPLYDLEKVREWLTRMTATGWIDAPLTASTGDDTDTR